MRSKFLFATATAMSLALSSGVANAATKSDAATAQPKSPDSARRYCVIVKAVTGTLVDRKVCMTRDELLAQGIDPTKLAQK